MLHFARVRNAEGKIGIWDDPALTVNHGYHDLAIDPANAKSKVNFEQDRFSN